MDLSLKPKKNGYVVLNYTHPHPHPAGDGTYYTTDVNVLDNKLWLCGVTEFVFGYMPEELWFLRLHK